MSSPVRVMLVTGSPLLAQLVAPLGGPPGFEVVAQAASASKALAALKQVRPQVVLLDLDMLGRSGLTALEGIMRDCPTPVILLGSCDPGGDTLSGRAMSLGAVDFVRRKTADGEPLPDDRLRQELRSRIGLTARVKVIRSLAGARAPGQGLPAAPAPPGGEAVGLAEPRAVIVIGASTGGPDALAALMKQLGGDRRCPAAVVIVQHIPAGLTGVLVDQLNRQGPMPVKEARPGDPIRPGLALLAPGDRHLVVNSGGRVELSEAPAVGGYRPAIDITMRSVAERYGPAARGVVLTGMGDDGARGVVAIRQRGGRTFAQEGSTCLVNGMPQRAIETGAVEFVASPAGIARLLRAELFVQPETL